MSLSYAFSPDKGETPQTIAQRRQMSNLIAARMLGTAPKNVGEGLNAIGQALIARSMMGDADAAQKAGEASLPDFLKAQITGQPAASSVATPPAVAATPMGGTSIPSGEIDPRLKDAISNVVAAHPDVDPAYMARLALVENGGKVEGDSPLSSAQGPFQFLRGTAKQYGLTNPNDPTASADAAARLTMDNRAALTQALGREPTPGELYLAHQQGAGGAAKLLQNPNAPVESVVGMQAARNNAATPGMTAGQFANRWTGKFNDIVQTVDPAQKNIIDAQADMPVAAPTAVAGASPAPVADDSGAALPPNAQPTGGALPTAQAVQAAAQPQNRFLFKNASDEDLQKALLNPFTPENVRTALTQEYKMRADAAQKAADPMRALDMEYKRALINKATGKGGTAEFSKTPVYGTDPATGETVIGTVGSDGSFKKIDTGSGFKIQSGVDKIDLGTHYQIRDKRTGQVIGVEPKDLKGAEAQKALGKAQGGMQASLPGDIQNAESTITQIDQLVKHPGLSSIVGPVDQFRPSWTMGSEGRDALARYNQLKGKAFLQAYSTLRGGGQITEVEGTKAENAMARMDRAQSEAEFTTALQDFRDAVKVGMQKLREKAGVTPSTAPQAGPVTINGYKIEAVN